MKGLKSLSALIGSAVLLNALLASSASAGLLEKGRTQGLTAGIANEQPYAYIDTSGKTVGANVEILQAILSQLGITKVETPITNSARWYRGWPQAASI